MEAKIYNNIMKNGIIFTMQEMFKQLNEINIFFSTYDTMSVKDFNSKFRDILTKGKLDKLIELNVFIS